MRCPRCASEIQQSPCPQCGLVIHTPTHSASFRHTPVPPLEDPARVSNAFSSREEQGRIPHRPSENTPEPKMRRPFKSPGSLTPLSNDASHQGMPVGAQQKINRYRLSEKLEEQSWGADFRETWWGAHDDGLGGKPVVLCEVISRLKTGFDLPPELVTATKRLAEIGQHRFAPGLLDMYNDRGRAFFVFEAVEGETLLSRLLHSRQTLSEREALECALQITEGLESFAQQAFPLVHGRISPEHIVQTPTGWMLIYFSPVAASAALPTIAGIDPMSRTFLYTAPEFIRQEISVRSDLYALLATIYYAATKTIPASGRGNILQAKLLNPALSTRLNTILMKGLHTLPAQRYQHPQELRQDLWAALSGGSRGQNQLGGMAVSPRSAQNGQPLLPLLASVPDPGAGTPEIISPEEFSPLPQGKPLQAAIAWLVMLLICLLLIISMGRGWL